MPKINKDQLKTLALRATRQIILPVLPDNLSRFKAGALMAAATCPAGDTIVDAVAKPWLDKARSYGIMDEQDSIDIDLAEAALHGGMESLGDEPLDLGIFHKSLGGIVLDKRDMDTIITIAREIAA